MRIIIIVFFKAYLLIRLLRCLVFLSLLLWYLNRDIKGYEPLKRDKYSIGIRREIFGK